MANTSAQPLSAFGPDFPFAYDDWLTNSAGLGSIPADRQGTEVAVVGGGIGGSGGSGGCGILVRGRILGVV